MKIVSIHVVAFGKLKNVNLQLNSGLNVLQHTNGFGKTTLASFIRAMLYGFTYTRANGVTDASHYAPWGSTEKFGGSMVVEHNGERYRIERFFGATARQETVTLTNELTGKDVTPTKQIGEYLLGLTADSYDRSAYFPQEAVELTFNDNLEARLANLAQDGAETYDKVQEKLRAYKKNLRHERGNGGKIYELDCKKRALEEQLLTAQNAEKRAVGIEKRLAEIAEEREKLTRRHAEYSEQLTKLQNVAFDQSAGESGQVQQTKGNNKLLLFLSIAFAVLGILFLALGVAGVLGVTSYIVGAVGLALGICSAVAYCVLRVKSRAKRRETTTANRDELAVEYAQNTRNCISVLTELTKQMSELANEAGRLSEERRNLVFDSASVQDKILTVDEQRRQAIHQYEVADCVVKLLEQAKDNLSSSYLPRLCARCTELLQEITESELSVVVDRSFNVSVREKGKTQPMSEFSRGIREIILLCFRVALSELLYDGAIPFVIIDDAFVNFDERNFVRATNLLKKLSEHAQVVYLTCHERTGNLLTK